MLRRLLALPFLFAIAAPAAAQAPPPAPLLEGAPATAITSAPGPAPAPTPEPAPVPRFFAAPFLLVAHLQAGFEPHKMSCDPQSAATCTVTAFSVGGEALWHGLVGLSLGLYASAGSPVVPVVPPGLPDRVSTTIALGLRPLAGLGWKRGDTFVARLLAGIGIEVGPSIEYLRTSSATLPNCDIPATVTQSGLHLSASVELPLLGDARTGWLSLRLSERLLVNAPADLAPTVIGSSTTCTAQVHASGTLTQTLLGLAYSF